MFSTFLIKYVESLRKFWYVWLVLWVGAAIAGSFFAMDFISHTKIGFKAPSGTPAANANIVRAKHFPASAAQADISLFAKIDSSALNHSQQQNSICPEMLQYPDDYFLLDNDIKKSGATKMIGALTSVTEVPTVVEFILALNESATHIMNDAEVANYYGLLAVGATDVASRLVSKNKELLLLPIVLPVQFTDKPARDFAASIVEKLHEHEANILRNTTRNTELLLDEYKLLNKGSEATGEDKKMIEAYSACITARLSGGGTGVPIMESAMVSQSKKDLAKMDAVTIPIALCVMGFVVRSLRLLLFPLLSIGFTLALSFGLMTPIAEAMDVSQAAPSLMMSLAIAMSIDYSIFLLSRFVEEVRAGQRGTAAVLNTLKTAGHTIFLSGLTLCISFAILCAFPVNLLRSFGIGCALTILIALMINLNLVPVLLILFFNQLEGAARPLECCVDVLPSWRIFRWLGFATRSDSMQIQEGDDNDNNNVTPNRRQEYLRSSSPVPTLEAQESFGTGAEAETPSSQHSAVAAGAGGGNVIISPSKQQQGGGEGSQVPTGSSLSNSLPSASFQRQVVQAQKEAEKKKNNKNNKKSKSEQQQNNNQQQQQQQQQQQNEYEFDPAINPVPTLPLIHDSTPNFTQNFTIKERGALYGEEHADSIFYKIAPLLHWPWNFVSILLLAGLVGYVGSWIFKFEITDEMSCYLQRGSADRNDFMLIKQEFSNGAVFPYQILFVLEDEGASEVNKKNNFTNILGNASSVNLAHMILQRIVNVTGDGLDRFSGPFAVGGDFVSFASIQNCTRDLPNKTKAFEDEYCDKNVLAMLASSTIVSPDGKAALVRFISSIDPTGNQGRHFYFDLMLNAVKWRPPHSSSSSSSQNHTSSNSSIIDVYPDMRVLLLGVGPMSMDTIDTIYKHFPLIGIAASVAICVMIGVAFRSIVVPFRAMFSIALTEAFVFGFAVLVYQFGILDWLDAPAVGESGAMSFLAPIVAFVVIIGVSLDFDLFLVTRIVEYIEHEGVTTAEGTLLGVAATGSVITAAGLVQAIAFSALMLTGMKLVNILGFFLAVATIFDTSFVRIFFVPQAIAALGHVHWWPSKLEQASFSHVFLPGDSISARASALRRSDINYGTANNNNNAGGDYYQQQQQNYNNNNNKQHQQQNQGGVAGEGTQRQLSYNPIEVGRVNKSAALLEQQQQQQRLRTLFNADS